MLLIVCLQQQNLGRNFSSLNCTTLFLDKTGKVLVEKAYSSYNAFFTHYWQFSRLSKFSNRLIIVLAINDLFLLCMSLILLDFSMVIPFAHDKDKNFLVKKSSSFFQELGVVNAEGKPRPGMSSKLKQCQRFVETVLYQYWLNVIFVFLLSCKAMTRI